MQDRKIHGLSRRTLLGSALAMPFVSGTTTLAMAQEQYNPIRPAARASSCRLPPVGRPMC